MAETDPRPRHPARRALGALVIGLFAFVALWWLVFSAVTAALVAAGLGVVAFAAGAASDLIDGVVEAIGAAIGAILAVIAAAFAAIFSIFS